MTTDANRTATQPVTPEQRTARKREGTAAVRAQYRHELGVPYGSHPRQTMDIYQPMQTRPAPVYVFIHGGGFRNGEAALEGYVGGPLLALGTVYVTMGYRLVPDARYPESCDDIESGLRWVFDHIAEHGGDPNRIYLSGTSAGATLAAAVALRDWVKEPRLPADLIKGLVLFSGPYDRSDSPSETDDHNSPRFVPDLTKAIERLPAQTIVISTGNDMAFAQPDADAMTAAIQARGGAVEQILQTDADHFTSNRSLVEGEGAVFEAVRRMMQLS